MEPKLFPIENTPSSLPTHRAADMVNQAQSAFINVTFHSVAEKYFKCGLIYGMMVYFLKNCLPLPVLHCTAYANKLSLGRWVHSLRGIKG